jgi:hypothetical protein
MWNARQKGLIQAVVKTENDSRDYRSSERLNCAEQDRENHTSKDRLLNQRR